MNKREQEIFMSGVQSVLNAMARFDSPTPETVVDNYVKSKVKKEKTKRSGRRSWTPEDDEIIVSMMPEHTAEEIGAKLGTTAIAVRSRINVKKLRDRVAKAPAKDYTGLAKLNQ